VKQKANALAGADAVEKAQLEQELEDCVSEKTIADRFSNPQSESQIAF
jgi:hypothetical protein